MPKGKRKGVPSVPNARNDGQSSVSTRAAPSPRKNVITDSENLENIPIPSAFAEASNSIFSDTLSDEDIKIDCTDRMLITAGLPAKQAPGKLGRKIKLISNLFSISLLPDGNIYHYDVKIINLTPDTSKPEDPNCKRYSCMNTRINREIIDQMLKTNVHFQNSYAVYDGNSNLYTPSPLHLVFPYESGIISIENENKNPKKVKVFKVQIKPVEKKNGHGMKTNDCTIKLVILHELFSGRMRDIDDIQEAVMAVETIFRHSPALKYTPIGRNFFHPHINGVEPLNGGTEIWFGYHQSARLGQWNLMINLNTSATTFFQKQSLMDYVAKSLKSHKQALSCFINKDENTIKRLSSELKNVKIETYHQRSVPKMTYRIARIVKENSRELKFKMGTSNVTVVEYFLKKYRKELKYPHLPCVQVKPEDKRSYIPIELCHIPEGQHCRKELTDDDKREMIKYTADPPSKKFNQILDLRNKQANYDNDEYLKNFGIEVEHEPIHLPGRVIEAPNLNYKSGKIQPKNGTWNIKHLKFYIGSKIASWILLSLASEDDCEYENLGYFSNQLQKIGNAAGLVINGPVDTKIIQGSDIQELLKNVKKEFIGVQRNLIQFIVVVIPYKSKILYRNVKQIAEVELGLLTQCIDHKNVLKCNPSLLSNLCQKINAKMGGINHTLTQGEIPKIMEKPVIVIGADVSHAPVTDRSGISVAAVAGGLDMKLSRFAVVCKLQKNPKASKKSVEIILELKDMVKALLKAFYNHTMGKKPEKIIFYRDGVSDGHFQKVKEEEIMAVRRACIELQNDYQPAITFVIVQKRHHVRFRPEDFRDGVRPEGNVPPGTVVDTDIVHPVHRDFYLCSHLGLKGTSRPAHYTVLEDDNEFSADDLQKLTYYLCNISFRCSKSISIPVPVAYADLAAYRTRLRLFILPEDQKEKQIESNEILQETMDATQLVDSIKNSMYFV
ncbi:protein argonaute-4 [Parasteatoda tepidariorum]|uniref:protein argonaute-4 n=1 Tax=Parasteatoda tepidariorum TaxID=114398 RepID=UPI001C72904F|nr:protein argonaute-4 [Parasteatoda tepidariorum]XP_042908423.1 protein argonaute-4 [Parasteatoda tepidariorum]